MRNLHIARRDPEFPKQGAVVGVEVDVFFFWKKFSLYQATPKRTVPQQPCSPRASQPASRKAQGSASARS